MKESLLHLLPVTSVIRFPTVLFFLIISQWCFFFCQFLAAYNTHVCHAGLDWVNEQIKLFLRKIIFVWLTLVFFSSEREALHLIHLPVHLCDHQLFECHRQQGWLHIDHHAGFPLPLTVVWLSCSSFFFIVHPFFAAGCRICRKLWVWVCATVDTRPESYNLWESPKHRTELQELHKTAS